MATQLYITKKKKKSVIIADLFFKEYLECTVKPCISVLNIFIYIFNICIYIRGIYRYILKRGNGFPVLCNPAMTR